MQTNKPGTLNILLVKKGGNVAGPYSVTTVKGANGVIMGSYTQNLVINNPIDAEYRVVVAGTPVHEQLGATRRRLLSSAHDFPRPGPPATDRGPSCRHASKRGLPAGRRKSWLTGRYQNPRVIPVRSMAILPRSATVTLRHSGR